MRVPLLLFLALAGAAACRRSGLTSAQKPTLNSVAVAREKESPDTEVIVEVNCDAARYVRVTPYAAVIDPATALQWSLRNSNATGFKVRKKKYIKWPYDKDDYPGSVGSNANPGPPKNGANGVYLYNIEVDCPNGDHFTIDPILIIRGGKLQ